MDYEVKADLEAGFERAQADGEVTTLKDEVARLSAQLRESTTAARRPTLAGVGTGVARGSGIGAFLRTGAEPETKAFSIASTTDGGFALPRVVDEMIQATVRDISPIRRIATVVQIGTSNYRRLISTNNVASGWVTEGALGSRNAETQSLKFAEIAPPLAELYANPSASQNMLDDVAFDVEGWLAAEIGREFARAEGQGFVTGTGQPNAPTGQPQGFLTAPRATTADGVRPFGTLQVLVQTGGAFPASNPQDVIVNLIHTLRPAYRQGAVFVLNSATLSVIRRMKDTTGAFIWQPSMALGVPDTLFGYPVVNSEDMPNIGVGNAAVAFGNFQAGYLIAERAETTILRDPYTQKPYVNFYATKRVSGCVANSEAIKLLRFDA